jgi:hypothetical protein
LALAQGRRGDEVRDPQEATAPDPDPRHALEFAVTGDGLWLGYRDALHRGGGYTAFGLTYDEDDDFALQGRWMRFGEPTSRLALGVGLGLFGARVEEAGAELGAVTLTGAAEVVLELHYPVRFLLETSYAPDVATVGDGERVLDVLARLETDLSAWGSAYAGWRNLEVDLDGAEDAEIDRALQVGLRLGF